jgi:PAS domain-containing protein
MVGNPDALSWLYPDPSMLRQRLKLQNGDGFRDMELTVRRKDGSYRTLLMSNISREFPVPGWTTWAMGLDITALKESQRQAAIQQEELETSVRERTEELRAMVRLMAGRENRMVELKEVIRELRGQLAEAGIVPAAEDPLTGEPGG